MERPLPLVQWFNEIEARETPIALEVYEKILSDLKREETSVGEPPNYYSFTAVEGDGKFYTSNVSYSVTPQPWNSLAIFVNIKRTEENGLNTYHSRGLREELNGLETEIHFQLPEDRPLVSDNKALLDWTTWFLEAEERAIVVRGKFNIAAGIATNQRWIGSPLSAEQLSSLKEFLEGYLAAEKVNPILQKNLRRDLIRKNSPETQELLRANEKLHDLYALAIGYK